MSASSDHETGYPPPKVARAFIEHAGFVWHQRFPLSRNVYAPGGNDVEWLLEVSELPVDLSGLSVLDVGTTNGGAAFEAERRGAGRVVAVDIFGPDWFGFAAIKNLLASRVEYIKTSAYELTSSIDEQFDIVLFWGVLYHLRHPLLALDNLRAVTRGRCYLETAVADHEAPELAGKPVVRFYRRDELSGDSGNWFAPTITALEDWCESSGFDVHRLGAWPVGQPSRRMVRLEVAKGDPELMKLSYERPIGRLPDNPVR